MKTLEHIFTHSSGQWSVHKSRNLSYPFRASTRDLMLVTYPIIKKNCGIKSTIVVDLNLWIDISKSQTGVFMV